MTTDLVPASLTALEGLGRENPKAVIAAAKERATAVAEIIKERKLYTSIGGRDHVQVEGWTTLGAQYGLTGRITGVNAFDAGGWEAQADIVNITTGAVVCSASAECGTKGDDNWIGRASFQQRSMAQTRAISKAFRLCLSWVMVLGGYEATPAEEMDGVKPKSGGSARTGPGPSTAAQQNLLAKLLKKTGALDWYAETHGDRPPPELSKAEASQAIDHLSKTPREELQASLAPQQGEPDPEDAPFE